MKRAMAVACAAAAMFIGGCTSYYKVTDLSNGKIYYTTDLSHKSSGAASLKDARTGNKVSVQNSEIAQISKEEFDVARFNKTEEKQNTSTANPFK
jgi:hypothetical protein